MNTDLFGQPVTDAELLRKPRRQATGRPWAGGYAAHPGSGPAGERCGTCIHRVRRLRRSGVVDQKCGLMRHAWTCGPGSDIKCKTAACFRWSAGMDAEVAL